MQNTDLYLYSELPASRKIIFNGMELEIKNTTCSPDGIHCRLKEDPPELWISVCPRARCDAHCPFCIASGMIRKDDRIDLRTFEKALRLMKEARIIGGISITGGEPCGDMELLNDTICLIYETLGEQISVVLNTNGSGLTRLHELKYLDRLSALHLSRHHWDDAVNRSIFGFDVPTNDTIREVVRSMPECSDMFVLNCMLLKGYVDSREKVHRYLDNAIALGIPKASFITGTPVNEYIAERKIDYFDVLTEDDPDLLFTRRFFDHEFCRCRDGIYVSPQGKLIEFYGRSTDGRGSGYCRGLVYEADNTLRAGFGGKIIFQEGSQ